MDLLNTILLLIFISSISTATFFYDDEHFSTSLQSLHSHTNIKVYKMDVVLQGSQKGNAKKLYTEW